MRKANSRTLPASFCFRAASGLLLKSDMRLRYGCLFPQKVENLLVAGRCISAGEEAMGQLRLIPVCSATGEAAGAAAALSLKEGVAPRKLKVTQLQKTLMEQGMNLVE